MTTLQEAYDMIDRVLRNTLYDDDYAEHSAALDLLSSPAPALAQQGEQQQGWKLVPVETTKEMRMAAGSAYLDTHGYADSWIKAVYKAMLAAAPAPQPVAPLTDEQIKDALGLEMMPGLSVIRDVRRIEAAHGIKEVK